MRVLGRNDYALHIAEHVVRERHGLHHEPVRLHAPADAADLTAFGCSVLEKTELVGSVSPWATAGSLSCSTSLRSTTVAPVFNTDRMVSDYVERAYAPLARGGMVGNDA